ncbi:MAG: CvpA family protein [Bacilli bacterium]|nr:CvpA family protein [Bacilli bacterium]
MNIFDVAIILIILMFGVVGFKKGIIKETVSLVGLILVFVIAFLFKGYIGNILCKYLPFFNFTGKLKGLVTLNILMYQLIGFFLIYSILFFLYIVLLKMSSVIQKFINMTLVLWLPSKIGGLIVALIEGYIIMFVILLTLYIPLSGNAFFNESKVVNQIIYNTPILSNSSSNITKSIDDIYNLGTKIEKNEISTNEANLESLDIMLKHKIVSKKTVEQLIVLDKLKDVKDTDKVLGKYKE